MECIFIFVYLQISFTLIVLCHFSLNFLKERPAGLSHGMDKFKISTARNDISCNIISSWRDGAGHCCNECAQFSTFIAVPLHSGFVGYILFLDCVRIATLVIDKWPGRPWHSVLKRIAWYNGRSLSEKSIDFLRTQYSPDERKKMIHRMMNHYQSYNNCI